MSPVVENGIERLQYMKIPNQKSNLAESNINSILALSKSDAIFH